jgi:release factor glutamine methyltransferase
MNIKQIEKILTAGGIEENEAKIEAKMLIKHFLKLSDIDLALNEEFKECKIVFEKALLRVQKKIPIQHIIGSAYFMGEDFIVNDNVLIPRDETEILVRKAVEIINSNNLKNVLDIGTGSGCIACMTAKLTQAKVLGVDVSLEALQTALENSSKLGLFNKAIFRKSDIFSKIRENENFDMIISNPPYIPINQKPLLQKEVQFEPDLALFAEDIDGIEFYEKITTEAIDFLNENGYLIFELGINQSKSVENLMKKAKFKNIQIEKDLAGIERIIWGRK